MEKHIAPDVRTVEKTDCCGGANIFNTPNTDVNISNNFPVNMNNSDNNVLREGVDNSPKMEDRKMRYGTLFLSETISDNPKHEIEDDDNISPRDDDKLANDTMKGVDETIPPKMEGRKKLDLGAIPKKKYCN